MRKFFNALSGTIYLVVILSVAGCSTTPWPQSVPKADIIFQSTMNRRPYNLNFIRADGSDHQVLTVGENFVKAFWSSDGTILYGLSSPVGVPTYEAMGLPAYWEIKTGRFQTCYENLPNFGQITGYKRTGSQNEVLLYNLFEIVAYNLDTCQKAQTLVDFNDRPREYAVLGFSYFPETQELLYGRYTVAEDQAREYQLIKLDLKTGEQVNLAEGINPAWSPDGKQIAYLGVDGLYVMQANGKQPRQLIKRPLFDPSSVGGPGFDSPQPYWSPNGEWLVFHQCVDKMCEVEQTPIYKVRVLDGLEEKIFTGGKFPAWQP